MWRTVLELVWLLSMSVSDIRHRHVPVWMMAAGGLPLAAAGLAAGGLKSTGVAELFAALLPGAVLLALALTRKAGWGDGAVLLLMGLADGAVKCVRTFALGIILMAVFALVMLLVGKVGKETRLPCLPFLTAARILCELL